MIHCSKLSASCLLHKALKCTLGKTHRPKLFPVSPPPPNSFINSTLTNLLHINLRHNCLPSQRTYHVILTEIQGKQKDLFSEHDGHMFGIDINGIHTPDSTDTVSGKFWTINTDSSIATKQLLFCRIWELSTSSELPLSNRWAMQRLWQRRSKKLC